MCVSRGRLCSAHMEQPRSKGLSVLGQAVSRGCGLMWPVVTQLPSKALGLWVYLWGVYLHVLSLGLETTLLCLLELLRVLCLSVLRAGRAVLMAASSGAHVAQACSVYILLQGLSWSAQLAGSWVALLLWLFHALLEMLRRIPLIPIFDQVARWMVRTGVQASRALAQVRGMGTLVQLCAHVFFLGLYLCMHVCLSAISSQVRVRVQVPFRLSLPVRIHIPLSLGIKVRLKRGKKGSAEGEAGTPQGEARKEQKPCTPRRLEPTRREVSSSRSESSSVVPSAATLIIVVCVGFLVLMVILGLVRIHSLHRRVSGAGGPPGTASDPKDPDLFWDDSALTIIVNPMESYQSRQARVAGPVGGQQEDEDSSDSEAADSPSSNERRIIEGPPHRY